MRSAEIGLAWGSDSDAPSSEEAVPLAFEDLQPEAGAPPESVEPLMGLVGRHDEDIVAETLPDLEAFDSVPDGFQVEMSEDIVLESSGASEFQMPNAAEELFGSTASASRHRNQSPPSRSPSPNRRRARAGVRARAGGAGRASGRGAEGRAGRSRWSPKRWRELLARQGHHEEALSVYRELEVRAGGDSRLQQRIADLEDARPAPPPPQRYAAADTGGQSTRDFLHGVLASRPPPRVRASRRAPRAPKRERPRTRPERPPVRPTIPSR